MKFTKLIVALLLLAPLNAFGQTARQKYQEAKALEFRSDRETGPNRVNSTNDAFEAMAEAATLDPQYVEAFAQITRKLLARYPEAYSSHSYRASQFIAVGKKLRTHPALKSVAAEFARGSAQVLMKQGFTPDRPFVQVRRNRNRPYCNVPVHAEQIFELFRLAGSVETSKWGKYAADIYMRKLSGCGGEGGDEEPNPFKAFPIYVAVKDPKGMHLAGKMLGDYRMENYIFGGTGDGDQSYTHHQLGYRPFYDKAMSAYRQGGVTKAEIRASILRMLRTAEQNKYEPAAQLARKTLAGTF